MGRLVDDAVVVLESIHRHQRMGMSTRDAALHGTNAVALPVLASMLTTIAVLLPVLLLAGLAQRLFVPLALTVAVSMVASYFVSVMVTPLRADTSWATSSTVASAEPSSAFIDGVADGVLACAPPRAAESRCGRRRVRRLGPRKRPDRVEAAEHVLPRDRRVDGTHLRPARARHVACRTLRARFRRWEAPSRTSCQEASSISCSRMSALRATREAR